MGIKEETYKAVNHPLCANSRRVTAHVLCFATSFILSERKLVNAPGGAIEVICKEIRPATDVERTPFLPHDHIAVFVSA